MRVYDIRDSAAANDGIIIIGGMVGELIITFTCLQDYILASPKNQNFMFTVEMMEQFLTDLLCGEESTFPENSCVVNIQKSLEELGDG